ncbi:hypothetical protein ACWCXX_06430 [Streptomyces sp. NPDC001732]
MITLTKSVGSPDDAYRTLRGHTYSCAACRAGRNCVTAVRLGRARREARR